MPEKPPSSLRSRSRPGQWFDFNVIDLDNTTKRGVPVFVYTTMKLGSGSSAS